MSESEQEEVRRYLLSLEPEEEEIGEGEERQLEEDEIEEDEIEEGEIEEGEIEEGEIEEGEMVEEGEIDEGREEGPTTVAAITSKKRKASTSTGTGTSHGVDHDHIRKSLRLSLKRNARKAAAVAEVESEAPESPEPEPDNSEFNSPSARSTVGTKKVKKKPGGRAPTIKFEVQRLPSQARSKLGVGSRQALMVKDTNTSMNTGMGASKSNTNTQTGLKIKLKMPTTSNLNLNSNQKSVNGAVTFCSGCRDGGDLVLCSTSTCERGFCSSCIEYPANIKDQIFTCPQCWHMDKKTQYTPYAWNYIGTVSTREMWTANDIRRVTVISIRLSSINTDDVPAHAVYYYLRTYLGDNVNFVELAFSFSEDGGVRDYEREVEKAWSEIERGERYIVFLASHTDPDSGYVHTIKEDEGCSPLKQLLSVVFPPKLKRRLSEVNERNICAVIACGALIEFKESSTTLLNLSESDMFQDVIAPTQPHFQGAFSATFYSNYCMNYFVRHIYYPTKSLACGSGMGAHTGLIHFYRGVGKRYEWSHATRRPLGHSIRPQCPKCKGLRTWKCFGETEKLKSGREDVRVRCRAKKCDYVQTFSGLRDKTGLSVHGELKSQDGAWVSYDFEIPVRTAPPVRKIWRR